MSGLNKLTIEDIDLIELKAIVRHDGFEYPSGAQKQAASIAGDQIMRALIGPHCVPLCLFLFVSGSRSPCGVLHQGSCS